MTKFFRFNKYSQIASRALRQSLKESERVQAERRGLTSVRYQNWENGQGGEQVSVYSVSLAIAAFELYSFFGRYGLTLPPKKMLAKVLQSSLSCNAHGLSI